MIATRYCATVELRLAGAIGLFYTRNFPFVGPYVDKPSCNDGLRKLAIEAIRAAGMEPCFIHDILLRDDMGADQAASSIAAIRENLTGIGR